MPTYPIELPSTTSFTSIRWNAHSAVAVSTSKFSGKEVVYAHSGQYWEVEFDLPPLNASQSAQFSGSFLSLNGREGTFYVYPSERQPQSPITGTKLIRSVSDYEITFESISGSGSFTVGDWVTIEGGLYRVTVVTSATVIEVWPKPRGVTTSEPPEETGSIIYYSNPRGVFRLYDSFSWDMNLARNYGISVAAREVI